MKLNSRGGISILELAVYAPAIIIAFIVCKRHGFGRSSGWIYTLILCLIRIIGACCQLATYSDDSTGLLEATIILDSIGISPLLFATLGLLSRCIDSINTSHKTFFGAIHFRLIQLLIMVGLILSIVGGTSSISSTGVYKKQVTSEVGIALYCVAFLALALLSVFAASKVSHIASTDNRLLWAVVIALPLILVRLIYSLLVVFHHNHDFSLITGSVVILACMSVIEEILVVLVYLFVGWMTEAPPKDSQRPITNRLWKGNLGAGAGQGQSNWDTKQGSATAGSMQQNPTADVRQGYPAAGAQQGNPPTGTGPQYPPTSAGRQGRRGNGRGFRQGPIHGLIGLAVAAAQNNKGDVERG